jgi:hypothetical protein
MSVERHVCPGDIPERKSMGSLCRSFCISVTLHRIVSDDGLSGNAAPVNLHRWGRVFVSSAVENLATP